MPLQKNASVLTAFQVSSDHSHFFLVSFRLCSTASQGGPISRIQVVAAHNGSPEATLSLSVQLKAAQMKAFKPTK